MRYFESSNRKATCKIQGLPYNKHNINLQARRKSDDVFKVLKEKISNPKYYL
jgi:hypothetical protein